MTQPEKRGWFTGQTETEAYYRPNRRTRFLNVFLVSPMGDHDDHGWRKLTNFVFGWFWGLIWLLSAAFERVFRPKRWRARRNGQ